MKDDMYTADRHGKQHEISAIREIEARSTMKWAIKSTLVKAALALNLERFVELPSHKVRRVLQFERIL